MYKLVWFRYNSEQAGIRDQVVQGFVLVLFRDLRVVMWPMASYPHRFSSSEEVEPTAVDQEYMVPLTYNHAWV